MKYSRRKNQRKEDEEKVNIQYEENKLFYV